MTAPTPLASDPTRPAGPGLRLTAALVGNPNTGKTTLFNALSGLNQRVGNYPGVTVETKKGRMICGGQVFDLIDLPGTYSLAPRSPDEMVAVDVILGHQKGEAQPNVVVAIVDASNLDRNLYLTTQALELGVPVVVALNMIDVAERQGIRIDHETLGRRLGVIVVPIQANKGKGLDKLREAIATAARSGRPPKAPTFPEAFEREVEALYQTLGGEVPMFLVRRLVLDVGGYTEKRLIERWGPGIADRVGALRERLAAAGCGVPAVEARARYAWIREATTGCVQRPAVRPVTWTDRIDRVLTHRVWGTLIFMVLMFVVFESIFTVAKYFMDPLSDGKDFLADGLRQLVSAGYLPTGPLSDLLIDGILEGVGSVVVFLPQIVILFGFIAILEDCGYMARAAFLMDKLMSRCGLSGKSFIPMLSSVACAVPGIMATRVIENRRDRLATILVAPLMSCSARLPVYVLMIGAFLPIRSDKHPGGFAWYVPGLVMFSMYCIGLVVAPVVALLLKSTLLRGETPPFVMEMPLYKLPSLRTILRRMFDSAWTFLRRAGTLILASMVLVWALLYFPRGESAEQQTAYLAQLKDQLATAPDDERASLQSRIDAVERGGLTYDVHFNDLRKELDDVKDQAQADPARAIALKDRIDALEAERNRIHGKWKRQSVLGWTGRTIEPVVYPLGWDWRIGMAAVASFPAREVVVGTLGIIYNEGKVKSDDILSAENVGDTKLAIALKNARWENGPRQGQPVFTIPTAISLMVFFALCCQCASTLTVIRRETKSWWWPLFTFTYMTILAYVGALVVYQVGSWMI
jgi:ferrous iron transport protein B